MLTAHIAAVWYFRGQLHYGHFRSLKYIPNRCKKKKKDACSRTHNCYQHIPQNLHHFQQGPDKLTDKNPNLKNGQ